MKKLENESLHQNGKCLSPSVGDGEIFRERGGSKKREKQKKLSPSVHELA